MSHVVVIIQRSKQFSATAESPEILYTYEMPIPHDATPQQVGEMTRKAYKRLEGSDD